MLAGAALLCAAAAPEPRVRLAASNLNPAPGELVELEFSYAGPWPAAPAWSGVDRDAGISAEVLARAPGPLVISVEQEGLRESIGLRVHEAGNRGELEQASLLVRSLPALAADCQDERYPRLAGAWALGCGPSGLVDRAVELATNRVVELSHAARSPALAAALAYAPGLEHGLWRLPAGDPAPGTHRMPSAGVLAAATDGARAAVITAEDVQIFGFADPGRQRYPGRPAPWYFPAVASLGVAWVDLRDAALTGEDIWFLPDGALGGAPLVRKAGAQRHPAASGPFLGWIDEDRVVVQDLRSGERRGYLADVHTNEGLSLWGPVACYEVYRDGDVDLACSDGLRLQRPGNQRNPTRYGPWLLFREDGRTLLAAAPALVLDDDDPRASYTGLRVSEAAAARGARVEGGVVYALELPPGRWGLERRGPTGWGPSEEIDGGNTRIEAPWGDAIRLTPLGGLP